MRGLVSTAVAMSLLAGSASAQIVPVEQRYAPAPWWMREPVVASIGYVRTETQANRAYFTANFQVVERTAPQATEKAAAQVRALGAALQALGGGQVRVETTFSMIPLYEQYRDKDGNLVDNQRADKIDRYQVDAIVRVEVRDTSLVQNAYATVVAARPTSTSGVSFRLEADNEVKTWLYQEAVKDAARRARQAVDAAGGRLGAPKVIDPTGRACETDVLAGAGRGGDGQQAYGVAYAPPPPPPPAPGASRAFRTAGAGGATDKEALEAAASALQLTIQPPLQELTARACVIYALG
ncbi:MAG TPA: SIMPL domain-containing protein [Caulobacteraceae bacterium]|nr:SIMPL domain-containing protein [Caulobacteraceae bacterium]